MSGIASGEDARRAVLVMARLARPNMGRETHATWLCHICSGMVTCMQKVCRRCGLDLSTVGRVKDPQGQYFCEPCYAELTDSEGTVAGGPVGAASGGEGAGKGGRPAVKDEYDLTPREVKKEPMATCGVCGESKPARVVAILDGQMICRGCRAERGPQKILPKRFSELAPEEERPSKFSQFMGSWQGILATSIVCVALTYAILLAVSHWTILPYETVGGLAVKAGRIVVYCVVLAGVLLASMLLVDRLFGGLEFGTVSSVIWKSMLIVVTTTVLSMFGNVNETVWWLSLAVGPLVMLIGFMMLFKIDFFEAICLSLANFFCGMGGEHCAVCVDDEDVAGGAAADADADAGVGTAAGVCDAGGAACGGGGRAAAGAGSVAGVDTGDQAGDAGGERAGGDGAGGALIALHKWMRTHLRTRVGRPVPRCGR